MRRRALWPLLPAALATWFAIAVWQRSTFIHPPPTSIITDRNGIFMAQIGAGPAGYGYWPVATVPPRVAVTILALEDHRFYSHPGIDPIAVIRALASDISSGRRISGASTLAMQIARMQNPEARTPAAKLMEAATALTMTARYGRQAILKQYLTLVPLSQNTHGIAYAATWYFNRPVTDLSWAQIAFLAAIPQAPSLHNPARPAGLARIKTRAATALARLYTQAIIDTPTYQEALADLSQLTPIPHPHRQNNALHAILQIAALTQANPPTPQIRTTIDSAIQNTVTQLMNRRLIQLAPEGARQAAIIIADTPTMSVLALAGSAAYTHTNDGEINYATRWRSPGSTLKPFIFAQALDTGAISPVTVLLDVPDTGTGVDNADRRFLGPLLAAQALGNSRNVPAAMLVRRDGLGQTVAYLQNLGLNTGATPTTYGLSLAIGAMPTELTRLITAYGALANNGNLRPLRWYQNQPEPPASQIMAAATAQTITLFLSDPMARLPSFARMGATEFPFPVAVKTGTSQGYRDAWVVEYTAQYIIAVWVGRPDGAPMDQLGGAASAALIGQDILKTLYAPQMDGQNDTNFPAPPGTTPTQICAATGQPATNSCPAQLTAYLPPGALTATPTPPPPHPALRIIAPLNHASYLLNPDSPPGLAAIPLRAASPASVPQIEWYVDGQPYQMAKPGDTTLWPATPGRHIFTATTSFGAANAKPVEIFVQ